MHMHMCTTCTCTCACPCPCTSTYEQVRALQAELSPPVAWLQGATVVATGGWNSLWPVALRALGRYLLYSTAVATLLYLARQVATK